MSLKLSILITADASQLKSEAAGGAASIETIGAAASSVAAEIGKVEGALTTAGRGAAGLAPVAGCLEEIALGSTRASQAIGAQISRLDALRAAHDPVFASAERLNRELAELAELERAGIQITGGYASALDRLIVKYDQSAAAAKRAAAERAAFLDFGRTERATASAQSAFSAPASLGRAGLGANWLSRQNAGPARSARDAAGAFDALFAQQDELEKMATQAAKLRAELDPVTAAQAKFTAEVAQFQELQRAGIIDAEEVIGLTALRARALDKEVGDLKRVQSATGLASHEMGNLGYQINDIVTMSLMGASPFQILASQGGQVYQVLAGSSGGVTGALKGIWEQLMAGARFVGPLNLGLIGLGVAGAGAAYLIGRSFPSATAVAEKHQAVIERATARYSGLSDAIERMRRESANAVSIDVSIQVEDAERLFRSQMEGLADYALPGGLRDWTSALQPISADVRSFIAEIEAGGGSVLDMREQLRALYKEAGTTDEMRAGIRAFLTMTESAAETEQQLNELGVTTRTMSSEFIRFQRSTEIAGASLTRLMQAAPSGKTQVQQLTEDLERWQVANQNLVGPSNVPDLFNRAIAEIVRGPREAAEEAERRFANLRLGPSARQIAELRQAADAEIAEMERVQGSAEAIAQRRRQLNADVAAVEAEIGREEDARRAGYALDLQAVTARTAAEKAAVEAERARISAIAEGHDAATAAARGEEARVLSLAQAREGYAESVRSQEIAGGRQLDQARLEYELIGRSVGEVARLQAEFQLLAQAKDAARAAGFDEETVALTEAMREQAAVLGQLADATARLNLERDQSANLDMLQAEMGLVRMSERDRAIARAGLQAEADLRRQGIAINDEWGRSYVQNARLGAAMQAEIDRQTEAYDRQHELLKNVASTFLDMFDAGQANSFFDRVLGGLADIGRQLAEVGKNKLLESLFGGGYTTGAPAPGQRSIFPSGAPQGGTFASGGGVRLYAPTSSAPSTASAAITEQLSTNVTKTVSDNLLRSMLYSGRDPSHITGLNRDFAANLTSMFEAAPAAVRASVTINSGFRSVARQAELFEAALKKYGSEVQARRWVAPPGRSQHNFGRAVDLGYGNDAARQWVHENAGRFGMRFPMSWEDWHLEPANARGGAGNPMALRTAVRDGSLDATRAIVGGQAGLPSMVPVPGARPSAFATGSPGVAATGGGGGLGGLLGGGGGAMQGVRNFLQSPLGGMNAISAFAGGMQSGSPIGGGFSGAMGAFGMGLGPVGIIAGGIAGLVGGLFGRSRRRREERRQRQEQERQQQLQAQQQLDQQLPAILELQDTLLDRASGTLLKERTRIESQIKQYQQLAKTAKNKTEIDRFASMQANLDDYMNRQYEQLRLSASTVARSLDMGRGLEPEFARAVQGIRDRSLAVRNYIVDIQAASGAGSAEVIRATEAGRIDLLRQLSGAQEVTEIYTRLDTLSGTAAQLGAELQKLGLNADEAAAAIRDHLNRGIQRMRDEFVRGIADETVEGMGMGWLSQIRALIERRDTMRADAVSLGADPALIDRWFSVQARNIVDQAGLVGEALDPLVAAFPALAGVLGDSTAKIERSLAVAEGDLRTAYSRIRSFAEALAQSRNDLRLDSSLSTLSPLERLAEAQNRFRDVATRAAAGDAKAQDELIGLGRSYLDEAKSYYASTEGYYAAFEEVQSTFASIERQAQAELDLAMAQHKALLGIDESVKTIPQALAALNEAMAARDTAQALALQGYVQALNPQAAIPSYQAPQVVVPAGPPPAPPAPAGPTYEYHNGLAGNWKVVSYAGRQFDSFVRAGETEEQAGRREWEALLARQEKFQSEYLSSQKRLGGMIGYVNGGRVANGQWDVDSVLARHSNGSNVALAGGEFVLRAPAVRTLGEAGLEYMNETGRFPGAPTIALPSAGGADQRATVAAIGRLERSIEDVAGRLARSIEASDDATRHTIRTAGEAGRRRAESAERINRRMAGWKAA